MVKQINPSKKPKIIIIVCVLIIIVGLSYLFLGKGGENKEDAKDNKGKSEKPIVKDKDEHGCKILEDFIWCEEKQKCLIDSEEPCGLLEAYDLLGEIKKETGIDFSKITKMEIEWNTRAGKLSGMGRGFDTRDITVEAQQRVKSLFTDKGFTADSLNTSADTIFEQSGYIKDNMACIVTTGITGYLEASGMWVPPKTDKKDMDTKCALIDIGEKDNWQTYENKEHSYSLKYPVECASGPLPENCEEETSENRPPECLCSLDSTNPDRVIIKKLTGTEDEPAYASLLITYNESEDFALPEDAKLPEWLKEKYPKIDIPEDFNTEIAGLPAIKVNIPESKEAGPGEDIFFLHGEKLINFNLKDTDNKDNKNFYDQMLEDFLLLEN